MRLRKCEDLIYRMTCSHQERTKQVAPPGPDLALGRVLPAHEMHYILVVRSQAPGSPGLFSWSHA